MCTHAYLYIHSNRIRSKCIHACTHASPTQEGVHIYIYTYVRKLYIYDTIIYTSHNGTKHVTIMHICHNGLHISQLYNMSQLHIYVTIIRVCHDCIYMPQVYMLSQSYIHATIIHICHNYTYVSQLYIFVDLRDNYTQMSQLYVYVTIIHICHNCTYIYENRTYISRLYEACPL